MDEEAKAIQEISKASGKAIDAAREAGGFIAKFISGPLEQGMGIFEDRLKYARWERQVRLIQRAEQMLKEVGLNAPTKIIPLKLAIPLLQGATLEDDDDLQDRWAALLVNAANANFGSEIRRAHIEILSQVTSLDAQILDTIYSLPFAESLHAGIVTSELPHSARIAHQTEKDFIEPSEEIVLSISNLARLGCLKPTQTMGGGEIFGRANPTTLGQSFFHACHLKH